MRNKIVNRWFVEAFGRPVYKRDPYYYEWVERINKGPVHAWSMADKERRAVLKRFFPLTFGGLDLDTNLNNPEFDGQFRGWIEFDTCEDCKYAAYEQDTNAYICRAKNCVRCEE